VNKSRGSARGRGIYTPVNEKKPSRGVKLGGRALVAALLQGPLSVQWFPGMPDSLKAPASQPLLGSLGRTPRLCTPPAAQSPSMALLLT
jgi:hypothetical protein